MDEIISGLETIRGGLRCICSLGGDWTGAHDSCGEPLPIGMTHCCGCQCSCNGTSIADNDTANKNLSWDIN